MNLYFTKFEDFAEFSIIPFHLKFRQYNVNSSQSRNVCPIYMSRFFWWLLYHVSLDVTVLFVINVLIST